MTIGPITAVGSGAIAPAMLPTASLVSALPDSNSSFASLLTNGLAAADAKVAKADALIEAFALGEPIPTHQITIAMEQARIAVELSVQIRERVTETYRSFMNLQL